MMESFGWARRPMLERIHLIRKDVPITMIYGANTWIDTSTGKKVKMQRPDSYVRDMVGWLAKEWELQWTSWGKSWATKDDQSQDEKHVDEIKQWL